MSPVQNSRTLTQRFAVIAVAIILIYAAVQVARGAMASLAAVPALGIMADWEEEKLARSMEATPTPGEPVPEPVFSPPAEEWKAARDAIGRALALSPGNPELHANLGRLYQYRFEDGSQPLEQVHEDAELALAAFRRAASLRPTWPYHWWDIARAEYVLQRSTGPDFRRALNNTVRFGPWLDDVQLFAADLALEHWEILDDASRQLALANLDRALARSPDIAPEIIASYDARDTLCGPGLEALPRLSRYCTEAPPLPPASAPSLLSPPAPAPLSSPSPGAGEPLVSPRSPED